MSRRELKLAIALWLPAAVLCAVFAVLIYATAQQGLRASANDPQYATATSVASALGAGADPRAAVGNSNVDLRESLGVSVSVFDAKGHLLKSDARLDGKVPAPPAGMLEAAKPGEPNVVTWQPAEGVRQAAVVALYKGGHGSGTVVAARSLRLVEEREDALGKTVLLGGLAALLLSLLAAVGAAYLTSVPGRPLS